MNLYQYIVTKRETPSERQVIKEGKVRAATIAVAIGRAARNIPGKAPEGVWHHVSVKRL